LYNEIVKELSHHGVSLKQGGLVSIENRQIPHAHAVGLYKAKAKASYAIVGELWAGLCKELSAPQIGPSSPPEGIESVFVHSLQGLKRMLYLYPGLVNFESIEKCVCDALCRDINSFSYRTMSNVIEYKLSIEWVSHLIAKNLYVRALLVACQYPENKTVEAKGVHGPYSNLDLPMDERVFSWSAIDEETRGRDRDIKSQRRYKMGLEGYNDPWVNEGFEWRELRNEPFLWGKEGENPYPHRNVLWGR
jgi:hypothetical protein